MTLSIRAHGATIRMNDTGGKISRCFRKGVPYEKPLLEHIYTEGFTGTAVDAGANIGNHTLWFAVVCGLDVAAFEPLHYQLLDEHVQMNIMNGVVTVEPYALGDQDGDAVHVGKGRLDPSGASDLPVTREPDVASGKWIGTGSPVSVRTLDSFDLHNVSVIKADVEGMEPYVLRGGEITIRRDRPVIFAETWGDGEHEAIAAVLEPWGYSVTRRFEARESPTPIERWDFA